MTGLEVAQTLQTWAHAPAIIFLTTHDGAAYREAARKAGAMAFITKDQMVAELLPLIENWNSRVTQTETVQ
jgi:DNA-binding LytR/AlgR family response regulator